MFDASKTIEKQDHIKQLRELKMMIGEEDFKKYTDEVLMDKIDYQDHAKQLGKLKDTARKLKRKQDIKDAVNEIKHIIVKEHLRRKNG